jgi:hypothetical protein
MSTQFPNWPAGVAACALCSGYLAAPPLCQRCALGYAGITERFAWKQLVQQPTTIASVAYTALSLGQCTRCADGCDICDVGSLVPMLGTQGADGVSRTLPLPAAATARPAQCNVCAPGRAFFTSSGLGSIPFGAGFASFACLTPGSEVTVPSIALPSLERAWALYRTALFRVTSDLIQDAVTVSGTTSTSRLYAHGLALLGGSQLAACPQFIGAIWDDCAVAEALLVQFLSRGGCAYSLSSSSSSSTL